MSNGKSVLIPIPLVKQIIELLEHWDISNYDRIIRDDHGDILQSLNTKLRKLEIRDAYSKIVAAKNDDDRHDARINYLSQKAQLANIAADDKIG